MMKASIIISAVCVLLFPACDDDEAHVPTTPVGGRTVTIAATEYRFTPNTITAMAGSPITIVLQNQGTTPHSIAFNLPSGIATLSTPLDPVQTGQLNIVVPSTPGSYTFYCPVDGHRDLGMTGTLFVTAVPASDVGVEADSAL